MTAKILVVDDLLPNVKLLEAKLTSEYYDVITARNGFEALKAAKEEQPDIILLDVMMPEMDGYEACRQLKKDIHLSHIPVVMVTALSEVNDRVRGLEAGADDFLTKPIDDVALFARIRSLLRLKMMTDELRLRNQTGMEFGLMDDQLPKAANDISVGRVLIIDDDVIQSEQLVQQMKRPSNHIQVLSKPDQAVQVASQGDFDLVMVSTQLIDMDGLRLCSHMRSQPATRSTPLLILIEEEDKDLMIKGLDMGVNDYLVVPVDKNELIARINTQIRRKRFQDALKMSYQQSISMAVTDGLTNIYNRRYFDVHYANMIKRDQEQDKFMTVMMLDIDHFKSINDNYGHQAGDEVLRQVAARVVDCIRTTDLVARYGGEEFVVVTNASPASLIEDIAERIRSVVSGTPVDISLDGNKQSLNVTLSVGVATLTSQDTPEGLLARADKALYRAKETGRNKVVVSNYEEEVKADW